MEIPSSLRKVAGHQLFEINPNVPDGTSPPAGVRVDPEVAIANTYAVDGYSSSLVCPFGASRSGKSTSIVMAGDSRAARATHARRRPRRTCESGLAILNAEWNVLDNAALWSRKRHGDAPGLQRAEEATYSSPCGAEITAVTRELTAQLLCHIQRSADAATTSSYRNAVPNPVRNPINVGGSLGLQTAHAL